MERITLQGLKQNIDVGFPRAFMYGIHQMYVLVQKHMEKKLAQEKCLSFSQFWVVVCFLKCRVDKDEKGQSQSEVAKLMHMTEATISRHVQMLVKMKYLQKEADKLNRRQYIVKLTDKGLKEYNKAKKIIESELDEIFAVVEENDKLKILENFDKIIEKLVNIK